MNNEKQLKKHDHLSLLKIPLTVAFVGAIIYAITVTGYLIYVASKENDSAFDLLVIVGGLISSVTLLLPLSLGDMLYVLRYNVKGEKTPLKTKLNNYVTVCDALLLIYFIALHFSFSALSVLYILAGVYFALRAVYIGAAVFKKQDGDGKKKGKVKRIIAFFAVFSLAVIGIAYLYIGIVGIIDFFG